MFKAKREGYLWVALIFFFGLILTACGSDSGGSESKSDPVQQHPTGNQDFRAEDGEEADALDEFRTSDPDSNILPDSVDHSSQMPQARNQGGTGSCTAWSTGYYYKSYQEAEEEGWDVNKNAFSPMYLFAMQCRHYDKPYHMIRSWEIINKFGCAKLATLPYQDFEDGHNSEYDTEKDYYANFTIPDEVHEEANAYRSGEMTTFENLNQIKSALTEGPVILAINDWEPPPDSPSPEENYIRYNANYSSSGHAILCVGYDDAKFGTGALKFVNSWGADWAEGGFSWIRYSDESNVIKYAMNFKDITNPDNSEPVATRPDAPIDVSATKSTGPYVDINWSSVETAQYYRVYRAQTDDPSTYAGIGITYKSSYRDYPAPGIDYYYSVVSVNDLGESDHFASDDDTQLHVDVGSAVGSQLSRPAVAWISNNSEGGSEFRVSDIDFAATAMEVFVAKASEGPWESLGWIEPHDFKITWGDDSEYVAQSPFIRVRVTSADGYSEPSESTQVGEQIDSDVEVAQITTFTATPDVGGIRLDWSTNGGDADYFTLYRYRATEDQSGEWIPIYTAQAEETTYVDSSAMPGISYYYGMFAVFEGTQGEPVIMDSPVSINTDSANLELYSFRYQYGELTNPVRFEVNVWNNGGTVIDDYTIGIRAYDYTDGKTYILAQLNASDVAAAGQLPLQSETEHTLQITMDIPPIYADDHIYSWGIKIDYSEEISETYEDDNYLWAQDYWWLANGNALSGVSDLLGPDSQVFKTTGSRQGSTRPFSHKQKKSTYNLLGNSGEPDEYVGPIRFKKPDFNNDHAK